MAPREPTLQLTESSSAQAGPMAGSPCPECGNAPLIHKDRCDLRIAGGYIGSCD